VQRAKPIVLSTAPLPISLILLAALAVHLPLLLMQLPLKSYDTNFHIFFASHYVQHWFDPWNAKWYAGFSQTTYPPLTQQWVALVSRVIGLDMGYMAVQLAVILLLVVGVYRFSLLWVSPRKCLPRLGELSDLLRWTAGHHCRSSDLLERSSVSIPVGEAWQMAIVS